MKTSLKNFAICLILAGVVVVHNGCCPPEDVHIDLYDGISYNNNCIKIDSVLKTDTAYFQIGTFMCDSDTLFQYKYTNLLSAGRKDFKAYFIPYPSFANYYDDVSMSFKIDSLVDWKDLQEPNYIEAELVEGKVYSASVLITVSSQYSGPKKNWKYEQTTDAPEKIYYHYDWESNLHYDGMPYNADLVVLTFSIDNAESDSIARIDSVILSSGQKTIKANVTSQLLLRDTIDILTDTTYIYRLEGRMKGQSCGADLFEVRSHKGEIISAQDAHYRHQSSIYEYDE